MYNISRIRQDFPILSTKVYGRPLIYLDNAATTQKPLPVIQAIEQVYYSCNANVHRGVHYLSHRATELHEAARKRVASFLGGVDPREVIFTRGTTEGINLIATSFGDRYLSQGDEIIISTMEHHSNIVPWQMLCKRTGAVLKVIPIDEEGKLDMQYYQSMLSDRTKLVSVAHVSNVLGTINPVQEISKLAHLVGAKVLIDGAQAVAHCSVNVKDIGADFYVFSGHKIYGPTGIGVLYGKAEYLNEMPPYMGGGEMIAQVTFEATTYNELPFKFEAGTPDYVGSHALSIALDYVEALGLSAIAQHEHELLEYATSQLLSQHPDAQILGRTADKAGVLSFAIGQIHAFDLGTLLDQQGVAIRTGHHCAEPLLARYGYSSVARASLGLYNTKEEIDAFITALGRAVSMLR